MRSARRAVAHNARVPRDATTASQADLPGELSTVALQLHLCSAVASAFTERPGYVSDAFLATITDDITLAVLELELTDRWCRDDNGYLIPAGQLRRVIALLHEM